MRLAWRAAPGVIKAAVIVTGLIGGIAALRLGTSIATLLLTDQLNPVMMWLNAGVRFGIAYAIVATCVVIGLLQRARWSRFLAILLFAAPMIDDVLAFTSRDGRQWSVASLLWLLLVIPMCDRALDAWFETPAPTQAAPPANPVAS